MYYEIFKLSELLGGGGQNDMFAPPPPYKYIYYFCRYIWGSCPPPPPPPQYQKAGYASAPYFRYIGNEAVNDLNDCKGYTE